MSQLARPGRGVGVHHGSDVEGDLPEKVEPRDLSRSETADKLLERWVYVPRYLSPWHHLGRSWSMEALAGFNAKILPSASGVTSSCQLTASGAAPPSL